MKIDRLISIILLLLEKKKVSARELSETFEVSLRTIYRDIETIDMSGIPIISTTGVNGGFQIMEKYKIDKNVFSVSDIVALLRGLQGVSAVMSREELVNTTAKIQSLIPAEQANEIELRSNQVLLDLQPWKEHPKLQTYFSEIKEAVKNQQLISFEYFNRSGNTSRRKVEPYRVMIKAHRCYLLGFCLARNEYRLFKLVRISDLQILDELFSLRELPNGLPPTISEFTDMMDKKQITVKLLIHESARDKVIDYCGNENITPFNEEHFIALLPFIDDDSGYNLILGFGDKCECLEPVEVRNELIRRIENLARLYTPHIQ
jgi:predicted DNA-binding transcriptional regulator YafY